MGPSHTLNPKGLAHSLPALALLLLTSSPFLAAASASAPDPASASPPAEAELICHTDNPAECYPRVFSATDEFQVVREDQDLPPGLHVRLDVQTGERQAKLHDPAEADAGALAGLPVDRSVVVVDGGGGALDPDQIPRGAPAYEPVGRVKAPQAQDEGFARALAAAKDARPDGDDAALVAALEVLEDLAHDMYYGLQLASDAAAVRALLCLLAAPGAGPAPDAPDAALTRRPDFLAASALAAAVRNNPPALAAVAASWDAAVSAPCEPPSPGRPSLRAEFYARLAPPPGAAGRAHAHATRVRLAVLDGLLRAPALRDEFLARGGAAQLLRILLHPGAGADDDDDAWAPRRAKVARLVADTFLDEEAGATLGVWPPPLPRAEAPAPEEGEGEGEGATGCCAGEGALDDACWEFHLEAIGRASERDAAWSRPLLDLLRRRRPSSAPAAEQLSPVRDEL
ncbi:hypothetical protein GGS23DRAFT_611414 [Durotheca rogersii]|uniref:uncharacterized protein n=1 Tax=Durotheca rogersii TaxID=419775 RepID=UPI00221EFFCF|nr:uncharacterized protein GGS23DRAFT_611414 [Durotheca rogersii]KAI5861813.1 hypothetical protein GGS23DRAFT_611414 [Durotheca rogersii]